MSVLQKVISALVILGLLIVGLIISPVTSAAPVISNVITPSIGDTSFAVEVRTDVTARCFADYGLTIGYGSATIQDSSHFFRQHLIPITGLTASTLYHYRVTCTDANGQSTVNVDRTVSTVATSASSPTQPIMAVQVNPNSPDMTGAVTTTVRASGGDYTLAQFQTAINDAVAAAGKRIIEVEAGQAVVGHFTIGVKADGACIEVRSSAHASLPKAKRVGSGDAANLFTITTPPPPPTDQTAPLSTSGATRCFNLVGAKITFNNTMLGPAPGGLSQSGLVRIGTGAETAQNQLPTNFRIDRCWIVGVPLQNTKRGVYINGEDISIIDTTIEDFKDAGGDAQAILIGTAKRVLVLNTYTEGSGENVLLGGVNQTIAGYVTSDISFYYSVFPWRLSWKTNDPSWDGVDWITKNNGEIKKGERVLFYASLFGPWWSSEQTGGSISFKASNDDPDPAVLVRDIFFFRNKPSRIGAATVINGSKNPAEESADYMRRVLFLHNLFEVDGITYNNEDTGTPSSGNAALILESYAAGVQHYPDDLAYRHNTFVNGRGGDRRINSFDEVAAGASLGQRFIFQDNVVTYNAFGIKTDATAEGTASLNAAMNSANYTWSTNLIAGISTNYPSSIYVNTPTDIGFVNYNSGLAGGNFRLTVASPGHNTASDGTDIGADIDSLDLAIINTASGDWRGIPTPPTPTPTPGGTVIRGKSTIRGNATVKP